MTVVLRPFDSGDEMVSRRAHDELAAEGFEFLWGFDEAKPWADFLGMIDDYATGRQIPEDRVACALLVADVDGEIVGRISVRFRLNEFLLARGGHIGYAVRPAYRRRGYASEMLRLGLALANARGIDPVLVTCDDTNAASAAVIERAGGRLESLFVDDDGTRIRRYWISQHDPSTNEGARARLDTSHP